jgi:hypothetical protein
VIVDLIVGVFFGILNGVMGLIPDFTLPFITPGTQEPGGAIGEWIEVANLFLPLELMINGFLGLIALKLFVQLVKFIQEIWRMIPFKAS